MTEHEAMVVSVLCGAVLVATLLLGLGCLVGWCPTW